MLATALFEIKNVKTKINKTQTTQNIQRQTNKHKNENGNKLTSPMQSPTRQTNTTRKQKEDPPQQQKKTKAHTTK